MRKLNTKVCCVCKVEKGRTKTNFYLWKIQRSGKIYHTCSNYCKECKTEYYILKKERKLNDIETIKNHREKVIAMDSEVDRMVYSSEDEIMQQIDVFERIKRITYVELSESEKEIYHNLI